MLIIVLAEVFCDPHLIVTQLEFGQLMHQLVLHSCFSLWSSKCVWQKSLSQS